MKKNLEIYSYSNGTVIYDQAFQFSEKIINFSINRVRVTGYLYRKNCFRALLDTTRKKKNSILDGQSTQCKKHRKYKQGCKYKADKFGYINILIHVHVYLYSIHIHMHNTYAQKIPF